MKQTRMQEVKEEVVRIDLRHETKCREMELKLEDLRRVSQEFEKTGIKDRAQLDETNIKVQSLENELQVEKVIGIYSEKCCKLTKS